MKIVIRIKPGTEREESLAVLICHTLEKSSLPAPTLLSEGHFAMVCLRVYTCLEVSSHLSHVTLKSSSNKFREGMKITEIWHSCSGHGQRMARGLYTALLSLAKPVGRQEAG